MVDVPSATGSLSDRTVLLTGASGGIGAETAAVLGAAGANVIAQYGTDRAGAEAATTEIPEGRRLLLQADLAIPGAADALWTDALAWKGHIDVLVSNAGVMPQAQPSDPDEVWAEAWDRVVAVNVRASADLIRRSTNHFVEGNGGVLITISSWAAQRGSGSRYLAPYAASKAAITAVTKTIARAYARDNILAYCIAPGPVRTPMTIEAAKHQGGEDAVAEALVMGEIVPPREVAELVALLATGTHRHLTGATLDLNGASYIR